MKRGAACLAVAVVFLCWGLPVLAHDLGLDLRGALLLNWDTEDDSDGSESPGNLMFTPQWGDYGFRMPIKLGQNITFGNLEVRDELRWPFGPFDYSWCASRGDRPLFNGLRLPPRSYPSFSLSSGFRLNYDYSFQGQDGNRIRIKMPWDPDEDEWDWYPPRSEACQFPKLWIVGDLDPDGHMTSRFNQFAPRMSFTYDLRGDGQTVIRGGAGIFYNRESQFSGDPAGWNINIDNWLEQSRWGSFADQNGRFYGLDGLDLDGLELGGPILKDKLWYFSWQCCKPGLEQPLTLGKLSPSLSLSLEYTYPSLLEQASDPTVNPFLAAANRISEQEEIILLPNKIGF